jgi:hypothetical protein
MIYGNPFVYQRKKFSSLANQLSSFGLSRYGRVVVVDDVALATAGIKIVRQLCSFRSDCQVYGLEGNGVVSRACGHPISGTSDGDLPGLKRSVVCRRKLSVSRKSGQRSIGHIACDQGAHFIEFLFAGPVRCNFSARQ